MRNRLDKHLVEINLFSSRNKAAQAIIDGEISVNDKIIDECKFLVDENDKVECISDNTHYVSRGAYKLLKAFETFNLKVDNLRCLDIGASTGGFTQVLLQMSALSVCALDVGYNQLNQQIRDDGRVEVIEKCNFRYATKEMFKNSFEFFCSDVSFISLKLIIPSIIPLIENDAFGVLLVKPQFEAGKENVNKHGIVVKKDVHLKVIYDIINCVNDHNFGVKGLCPSSIKGKDGNIEYLLYIKYLSSNIQIDVSKVVQRAFE